MNAERYLDTTGDLKPDTILFPVSCCWSLGHSWSLFVAQSVLLKCCSNEGLTLKHCLCIDTPPPLRTVACFALTDETTHFTSKGPLHSHRRTSEIDKALVDHGTKRNAEKDVKGCTLCICHQEVGNSAIWRHPGTTFFLSPLEMHTLLGHFAWFFLLAIIFVL